MEARAYRQSNYVGDSSRSGRYIFDTTWTRGPLDNANASPIGQGFAAFLLGLPSASSNGYIARTADYAEQSTVWAGYIQDNWRARRNLTVSLGLRYELEGPLTERYNRSTVELPPSQFSVHGGLLFAGANGQPRELWQRDWNNLMPRAGLAWTPIRNTVFRSGYGIYYSSLGLRRTDVLQNGFARNTLFVPTTDSGLTFSSTLSNPFPSGILEPVGTSLGLMTDVGNTIEYFNPTPTRRA
jgi:hypothetical protein